MRNYRYFKMDLMNELEELNIIKKKVCRSLKRMPEGNLVVTASNGIKQFYQKIEGTKGKGTYLDKKHRKLIYSLAQKDYDERMLKEIEKRTKRLQRILDWLPDKGLEEVYEKLSPARKELVNPYVLTDEQYIEEWESVEYTGNEFYESTVSFQTEKGEKVRSKSEKIIADKLYSMGIPYRYEYPVEMDNYRMMYPDFTILDIRNRKEIYLEHLGMMDYPEYCEKALLKIQTYARNGIILGKNLLITFETSQNPLNINYLEQILKEML